MPSWSKDYESVKSRLMGRWGFSAFYAGSYAWSIQKGTLREKSHTFSVMKRGRREHVLKHYKDLGGRYKFPNFTKSEIGREAITRANQQLEGWGWEADNTSAYFAVYYYGYEKKKDFDKTMAAVRAWGKQFRKRGFILKIPK